MEITTLKTFLSIGSGPGMGLSTAERFAAEGFRVVLTGRSRGRLDQLVAQLTGKGHTVETAPLDASDPEAIKALIADLVARHGSIEVLHYNAASLREATIDAQPTDTFVPDLAVNIGGAMVAIQASLAPMVSKGEGTILLTGGGFAFTPQPNYISLSIGKAGLRALAVGLFESLKSQNIHIGIVNVTAVVAAGSETSVKVAEEFWKLHNSPKSVWTAEVTFS